MLLPVCAQFSSANYEWSNLCVCECMGVQVFVYLWIFKCWIQCRIHVIVNMHFIYRLYLKSCFYICRIGFFFLWTLLKCRLINLSSLLCLFPPPFAAWWCSEEPLSVSDHSASVWCWNLAAFLQSIHPPPHLPLHYNHLFTTGTL